MLPKPPDSIAALLARPVAVFGPGVSGQGVLSLLAAAGASGKLYDEQAAGAEKTFGVKQAATHGLVVFSPGFAPDHAWLAVARAAKCACLGELDFASLFWRGDLVVITGTNGKTTLTEFLAHALNAAGRRAHAAGNVGYSLSRFVAEHLPGDGPDKSRAGSSQQRETVIAVCEVSSFQAETLQHLRPTATLWTNFAEDHLERHPGFAAYFAAKWRLIERTPPGAVFVGSSVSEQAVQSGPTYTLPPSACIASAGQQADVRLAGTVFCRLPAAGELPARCGLVAPCRAARDCTLRRCPLIPARRPPADPGGGEARCDLRNDAKATNFHAVEAALAGYCRDSRVPDTPCGSLEEAVRSAFAGATVGDHVLHSPGFASFDMSRGYDDRGRSFVNLVENL